MKTNADFTRFGRPVCRTVMWCLMLCSVLFLSAAAKEPYNSYTYDFQGEPVYAPDAVIYTDTIDSKRMGVEIGKIADIVYGRDNRLYILDNEKSAIYICSPDGKLIQTIQNFQLDGKTQTFSQPSGLFVTKDLDIYVADTGNLRVVQLGKDGRGIRAIGEPKSTLLGANFGFKPTKVAVDSVEQIYIVSADFTNGLIVLDNQGEFLQCMGAPRVTFRMSDYLWQLISTKEQIAQMESFVPTEFNNISLDQNDFLYVTCNAYSTWDYIGGKAVPLRKLNARGSDVLFPSSSGRLPFGDHTIVPNGEYAGGSSFVSSVSLGNGMFAALDANRCKVFVYDANSELLFAFGSPGTVKGTFTSPCDFAWGNGKFYIADIERSNISVFRPTAYGSNLLRASELDVKGEYEAEQKLWDTILRQNNNNTIAVAGLARTAYTNGDYDLAMNYYKAIGDIENYSRAFTVRRREIINQYAGWMLAVIISAVILIIVLRTLIRRKSPAISNPLVHQVFNSKRMLFRPLSGSWDLIWEKQGSLSAGLILLGAATVVMLLSDYGTGYLFGGDKGQEMMLWIPLLKLGLFVSLLSLCNWCVSSLMDGKGTLKNIWMTNCYALTPLIILLPPAILLSHVLTFSEAGIYNILVGVAYAWVALLLICGNRQVHEYSMGKSLFVLFITLVVMIILIFLFILFLILLQQMYLFGVDIIRDALSYQ